MPEGLLDTPKHRGREQQTEAPRDQIPAFCTGSQGPIVNVLIYRQEPSDPGLHGQGDGQGRQTSYT